MEGVDVLSDVLNQLGLTTRLFCHSELHSPWGMAFAASALAHFHYLERGAAWLSIKGAAPRALRAGDLVVLPQGRPYVLADAPERKPVAFDKLVPKGDGRCVVFSHGGAGPATVMLCGSFAFRRGSAQPLLDLLPAVLHLTADPSTAAWMEHTLRLLTAEARAPSPGSETVVSRLTDVLFVQVLRAWLSQDDPHGSVRGASWLAALADPKIGRALSLMHATPGKAWTVTQLAATVGMSRSPFAARFLSEVGEAPKTYLTRLRLRKAAVALRESKDSIRRIAEAAAYDSEAAFSKAFSREFGMPPGRYRLQGKE